MTQEERQKEKELLLNVLKDGLPYGLQLQITDVNEFTFNGELLVLSKNWCRLNITDPVKRARVKNQTIPLNYIYIKPYLRSMSSMTKKESIELQTIINDWWDKELFTLTEEPMIKYALSVINYTLNPTLFDWCNKNHFDYRGLILKGLAIEAPEEMYGKD